MAVGRVLSHRIRHIRPNGIGILPADRIHGSIARLPNTTIMLGANVLDERDFGTLRIHERLHASQSNILVEEFIQIGSIAPSGVIVRLPVDARHELAKIALGVSGEETRFLGSADATNVMHVADRKTTLGSGLNLRIRTSPHGIHQTMVVRTFASTPSTLDHNAIGVNLGNINVGLPVADIHNPHYSETSVSAICLPVTFALSDVAKEAGLIESVLPLDATHVSTLAMAATKATPQTFSQSTWNRPTPPTTPADNAA